MIWGRLRNAWTALRASGPEWDPSDDRWYHGGSAHATVAGVPISADNAMQISTLGACVRLISGTVAKLPLPIYRRLSGGGRERATGHPTYDLLNSRPNAWQTAFEFRRLMTAHVCLRGNAYAEIVPGARGFADQLVPWHPDCVQVEQQNDGRLLYHVTRPRTGRDTYDQDRVLHLRDLSQDGVLGMSRVQQARQGLGLTLAAEVYAAAYFGSGAEPAIALMTEGKLDKDQRERVIQSWKAHRGGPIRGHNPFVGEGGLKIEKLQMTNRESQMLELRGFQVGDISRVYQVPNVLVGDITKNTTWGTGLEQIVLGWLSFGLMDWLVMWESSIQRDLILAPQTFYAEHLVEGLLRVDFKTRMEGYAQGIDHGIYSPDEVREKENMNARPDGMGGVYLRPANMVPAGTPADASTSAPPPNGTNGALAHVEATA